jgi:aryl-alcohol dehydrogenase-like predicted oxidoreductase
MVYFNVGSSPLKVSGIGFGCMSLPADEKSAIPVLHKAIELGINYLDTADIYNDGINELIIGKAIKGKRDNVVLASKAGNVRRPDGGLDWNPTKQHILSSIEGSLKRLQTDRIDLYQLHGGTIQDNIDETIEAFELLKQQGKIRYYGISSIRPNVIKEYIKKSSIVSVMTQYSLLDRRPEEETLELLHQNNIGVLVRGSRSPGITDQ